MSKTMKILQLYFVNDITTLILKLFQSSKRRNNKMIQAGEYEACIGFDNMIYGACLRGYHDFIQFIILNQKNCNWNQGLFGACYGGHMELVHLVISKGAYDWNHGLYGACRGGHKDLVNLMILQGANNWKAGLCSACEGGYEDLKILMISKCVE